MPLQSTEWILDPVGYMNSNFSRCGDIFEAHVLWGYSAPLIMVNEPKAIQYILTHDTGKEFTAPGTVNAVFEAVIGQQNLILWSGRQHRNRRPLVMPPFHGDRLQVYGQIIHQISTNLIAQWPINKSGTDLNFV